MLTCRFKVQEKNRHVSFDCSEDIAVETIPEFS
jgi:hypothetical protein